MHSNHTYIIYWNPSNCVLNSSSCAYDAGYQALFNGFLANVAADSHKASNVYALTGQYGDATGRAIYDSTFVGSVQDTDAVSTNGCTLPPGPPVSTGPPGWSMCVNNTQLAAEVSHVLSVDHLPSGIGNLYFVVMPAGFGSCFGAGPNGCSVSGGGTVSVPVTGSFCGYHTATGTSANRTLYADIPYNAVPTHCRSDAPTPRPNSSTADPTISTLSHEHNEAITDPTPHGVADPRTGWVQNTDGQEIGDLCAGTYGHALGGATPAVSYNQIIGTGHYLLQEEWSNEDAGGSCQPADERDSVSIRAPASTAPGAAVHFTGSATDPDGSVNSFVWNFGDGSPLAAGASLSHTFAHSGTFTVTLTIQDIGGQRASVSRPIRVAGPSITRVSSIKTSKHSAKLLVGVNGPGTVKVGGAHRSLSRAGTAKFTITLSAKGRKKLAHRGTQHVTVRVKVTFSTSSGTQTRTVSVTFRG